MARELAWLDIDIAALSKVCFAEQGPPHGEWSRLYPLLVWEEQGCAPPFWYLFHDQNFHCQKSAEPEPDQE